jgi:Tfp pilus assembly protein FimT
MKKDAGLTLVELAVAMALFAVLCALSVSSLVSWRGRARMTDAAMTMLAVFQNARMLAVRENAPVWVYCRPSENSYEVFVDNGPGEQRANGVQDSDETVFRGGLPAGVHIDRITRSPVKFNSQGIPHFGTALTLADIGGRRKQVIVSPSGHSRIDN